MTLQFSLGRDFVFPAPTGAGLLLDYASQAEAEAGADNTKVMTPLRVDQAAEHGAYTPGFSGSTAYILKERLQDVPHSRDFTLRTSNINDQTAGLQAFFDACASYVGILEKGEFLTEGVVCAGSGIGIQGAGGFLRKTKITGIGEAAGSGPVVWLKNRSNILRGISISASTDRRDASVTQGHGLLIGGAEGDNPSMSQQLLSDIHIENQPKSGLVMLGGGQQSVIDSLFIRDCREHGAVFDDGTYLGYSNKTATGTGIFNGRNWIIRDCAGNGLLVGYPGAGANGYPYRWDLANIEAIHNAWDSVVRVDNFQAIFDTVQTLTMKNNGWSDSLYSTTTTPGGFTRTGKGAPSQGLLFTGAAQNISNVGGRYITLLRDVQIDGSVIGYFEDIVEAIQGAPYSTAMTNAWLIASGARNVELHLPALSTSTTATTTVQDNSKAAVVYLDGKRFNGMTDASIIHASSPPTERRYILARGQPNTAHTGTTNETTLVTVTIPAGALEANDLIEIMTMWQHTSSANVKTLRTKLNGTAYGASVPTTTGVTLDRRFIWARNSITSQIGGHAVFPEGNGTGPLITSTHNMAVAQDITITAQLADSGETITLQSYKMTLVKDI